MNNPDSFSVYLRSLNPDDVEFEAIEDGRHILRITTSVALYVRPTDDDLPATIAALHKLAAAAEEMKDALADLHMDVTR